jgi:uncharacterized protein with HEPN domain
MTLRDEAYLRHMLDAIDRVAEAVSRTTLRDFEKDWVIQDAIIRELQIVGEAAGRITRELTTSRPEIPWAEITGLRHKLVHDYFVVDLRIVWQTATEDVPLVRPLIAKLLDDPT